MSPLESNTTPDPRPELVRISTTDGRTRLIAPTNAACMDCVGCVAVGLAPAEPEAAHPVSPAASATAATVIAYLPGTRQVGISLTMVLASRYGIGMDVKAKPRLAGPPGSCRWPLTVGSMASTVSRPWVRFPSRAQLDMI